MEKIAAATTTNHSKLEALVDSTDCLTHTNVVQHSTINFLRAEIKQVMRWWNF